MNDVQQYNSPGAVGWLLVGAALIVAAVLTTGLIRDKVRANRQRRAELTALRKYARHDVEETLRLFNTVQEARNDFR